MGDGRRLLMGNPSLNLGKTARERKMDEYATYQVWYYTNKHSQLIIPYKKRRNWLEVMKYFLKFYMAANLDFGHIRFRRLPACKGGKHC